MYCIYFRRSRENAEQFSLFRLRERLPRGKYLVPDTDAAILRQTPLQYRSICVMTNLKPPRAEKVEAIGSNPLTSPLICCCTFRLHLFSARGGNRIVLPSDRERTKVNVDENNGSSYPSGHHRRLCLPLGVPVSLGEPPLEIQHAGSVQGSHGQIIIERP